MEHEEGKTSRAWREIDLDALVHNARLLQDKLGEHCRLMAVVKADAYGHGAVAAAKALAEQGVDAFAVACLAEGAALRRAGIGGTILVLGYTPPEAAEALARWDLTQTVADEAHARALAAQKLPLAVHLALDTGMHRLGVPAEDREAIGRVRRLPYLRFQGTFSHLCVSDSPAEEDRAYTRSQLERFQTALAWMRTAGYDPGAVHIQASYGILDGPPQTHMAYGRAGIALYGVPSAGPAEGAWRDLRPVLSLRARVVSLRSLPAGQGAGYGLAFRCGRDTRLAVVSIGYADGLLRILSQSGGEVLIRGRRCPMAGRMCMDQLLVDVTELPRVQVGDVATLIGRDGGEEITAGEVAAGCGTITNELLSKLGGRLPAVYRGGLRTGACTGST